MNIALQHLRGRRSFCRAIPYDTSHDPPIPKLNVTLARRGERPWLGPYDAIVDTGADATIVPESIAQEVKASALNPARLKSPWGDFHPVTVYMFDIQINDIRLPGIIVAGDPEVGQIILGRNVLNKLPLFLDGPQQQTDILDEATVKRLRSRRKSIQ